ncbi:MAG: hypothetical protein K2P58_04230 [Hyphomonadaceae bacterium]|nr:hypothetical protein [Hyphomonadaceae bacterium]
MWGVIGVVGAAVVGGIFTWLASRRQPRSVLETTNAGERIDLVRRLAALKKEFSTRNVAGKSEQSVRVYIGQAKQKLLQMKNTLDAFDAAIAASLYSVTDSIGSSDGAAGYKKIVDATATAHSAVERKIRAAT